MLKEDRFLKVFAKNLREIRQQKELSQSDVARCLKVHPSYISGLERGVRNPSLKTIHRIANVLRIDPKELLRP